MELSRREGMQTNATPTNLSVGLFDEYEALLENLGPSIHLVDLLPADWQHGGGKGSERVEIRRRGDKRQVI
jgi:hypothetical protein